MLDTKGCRGQLMNIAQRLLSIDSPSGFTDQVVREAEQIARDHGYAVRRTNKGNLVVSVPGREKGKRVGLCAHIDTLGLMVRSITADGMLMTTRIGGPILPTLDGEYCRIHTRDGRIYTGTILSLSPAAHVFERRAHPGPPDEKNLAVRIDEVVEGPAGVEALGIAPGDFVCIDPKTVVTDSGFLKSRFIDDKGSAACLLTLLRLMHIAGQRPRYDTEVCFTVHEEVGHGGATCPQVDKLLAVDMGCVGDDLGCTERQVSICAKDNGGPYDYGMVTAGGAGPGNAIPYAVDIYPHYSSDITVAWHAGMDARGALIGPGVHASHGMERTHFEGMKATIDLVALYLELG